MKKDSSPESQRAHTLGDLNLVKPRFLTKSRFKLGMECPTKLFYTSKAEYPDQKKNNAFLKALAEGGFQVGELAHHRYPRCITVESLDYSEALAQTNELLKQENVVIAEAAILFRDLFIRVDLLVKTGSNLKLIEVKAKSYNPEKDREFRGRGGTITPKWVRYLQDVAFQRYVCSRAFPEFTVEASLLLADKTAECQTDYLNQKFHVTLNSQGRLAVKILDNQGLKEESSNLLRLVPVDSICDELFSTPLNVLIGPVMLEERIWWMAEHYREDKKIPPCHSSVCKDCEFKASLEEIEAGKKSGFRECWGPLLKHKDQPFDHPTVLSLWNYRDKDRLIQEGKVFMTQVEKSDIRLQGDDDPGHSPSERQWLQVCMAHDSASPPWIAREEIKAELKALTYPLHFIDFETTRVAIPFTRGRCPYELVAFQFSHHMVHSEGRVEHKSQYLNAKPGVFPNYEFVRALKGQLEQDQGSIFRYATHENSTLIEIHEQLESDPEAPTDAPELMAFIREITETGKDKVPQWKGQRSMVDLCRLVKRYYYSAEMNGSNSIKQVLPAILNSSSYLQSRYSNPIYGDKEGIPSLNFSHQSWVKTQDGSVADPYKLLPPLFQDIESSESIAGLEDDIREGGAAMTAYARLQFEDLAPYRRKEIEAGLLRYCELDTLAMVMIFEAWREAIELTQ
jgi:hypothetical protein